jgi:outer membrane protein TolC
MQRTESLSSLRFALLLISIVLAVVPAAAREVTIAVVKDGSGPRDRLVGAIEGELALHVPRDITVRFKADSAFDAGWEVAGVPAAVSAALDDPEVDLVLVVGLMGAREVVRVDRPLPKPVVCAFVQPADLFELAYGRADRSSKPNLSVLAVSGRSERDIRRFRDLVGFDSLTIAVTAEELAALPEIRDEAAKIERRIGVEVELVGVGADVERAISALSSAEAVYVTRVDRLDRSGRRRLFDTLASRKIPTFGARGHTDVELGALAGQTPDFDDQIVRRLALNLSRLIRGEAAEDLPVLMTVDTSLLINGATARTLGWSPDRETRIFARFLHPDALALRAETLELAEAFRLAEGQNTELEVEDTVVEGARQDRLQARSRLLPQLGSRLSWTRAETDRVDAEDATTGELLLRQQIWDDGAHSDYKGSQRLVESAEQERETVRLDVLAGSGSAYYGLGLAQALYRIEADNLQLTEEFLELARLRREVGYSGREEILRWESAAAEGRSRLFRAAQDVETTRISLNRILGVDQDRRWYPAEVEIDPEVFPWLGGALDPIYDEAIAQQRVGEEAIAMALENAPELRSLDRLIEAQRIEVSRLKRRYTVPDVFFEGGYSNQLGDPDDVLFADDWSYSAGVVAVYPLFEGGRRKYEFTGAHADLDGLDRQRELVAELIEQRTRTAIQRVESSFPRIKFSRQSADAAAESLELVREQYTEGTVNVTDLLDAQNQKFTADQALTIATFEFLADLIGLERAIAWFEADNAPAARDALVERLRSAAVAP